MDRFTFSWSSSSGGREKRRRPRRDSVGAGLVAGALAVAAGFPVGRGFGAGAPFRRAPEAGAAGSAAPASASETGRLDSVSTGGRVSTDRADPIATSAGGRLVAIALASSARATSARATSSRLDGSPSVGGDPAWVGEPDLDPPAGGLGAAPIGRSSSHWPRRIPRIANATRIALARRVRTNKGSRKSDGKGNLAGGGGGEGVSPSLARITGSDVRLALGSGPKDSGPPWRGPGNLAVKSRQDSTATSMADGARPCETEAEIVRGIRRRTEGRRSKPADWCRTSPRAVNRPRMARQTGRSRVRPAPRPAGAASGRRRPR
jgi:hypothetical protein